jgi:Rod binding domain-containing protein
MHVLPIDALAGDGMQPDNPRLSSAAHEFEASLMQEFLKPLQHDALFAGENGNSSGDDEGGSDQALMSFGSEALARAISERGGFGIATKILDHFRSAPPSETHGSKSHGSEAHGSKVER